MRKLRIAAALVAAAIATAAYAAAQDFVIVNDTGRTLMTLNVSPTGEEEWGPDLLGEQVMEEGVTATVTFDVDDGRCLWDLRASFEDGAVGDWRAIDLCEISTITLS